MTILIILVVCIANILCFYIGAKIGQAIIREEDIVLPHPVTAMQEHAQKQREQRKSREDQEQLDVILANIENYDGTGYGQRDVPDVKRG